METLTSHYFILLIAYILGSIPFGYLIAKFSNLGDIRKQGSGNIGATNMLRVGGKKLGLFTLILDGLKGAIIALYCKNHISLDVAYMAGLLAIIGHVFPIWLKFKGGKGVATALAVIIALSPKIGLFCVLTWLAFYLISKYVSLSSIIAFISFPIYVYITHGSEKALIISILISLIVIIRHKSNIERLIKGEEARTKI